MEPQNPNHPDTPEQKPTASPVTPDAPVAVAEPAAVPAHPSNENVQNPPHEVKPRLTERAEKLKKLALQVMIGGLIGAAVIAVIAVLAGSFNDTFEKALFTLAIVVVHALASLAFIERTGRPKSNFRFFEDAVFSIIVLSFFTAVLGIWGLFDGSVVAKLYGTYFILVFACLHGQMLVETRGKQASIDNIVNANYILMGIVIMLILPLIWFADADFPAFYYRLLAACGIIDGTLTILAVIFSRLYLQKHPKEQSAIFSVTTQVGADGQPIVTQAVAQKRHVHPLIWLLGIYIVGQFIISALFAALGAFYR